MGRLKTPLIYVSILIGLIVVSGQRASAIEHHVVGDNNGWDSSSDLDSWSSSSLFKVGDIIWFTYNFTGQESVVELGSIEELSSCELSNPIKMYTDGLNKVSLDGEGARFFASGNSESCKKGLKIHVNVHPKEEIDSEESPPTHPPPGPDEDSPPTPKPKPKPKPKRSPPPSDVLPDDESPTTHPPPDQETPPTHSPPPEAGPDEDSPPTPKPKPKPKPKRSPPPPDVLPDDDSPPTPKPKPHPPPSSTSTMLDGCLFSMILALLVSYLVKL